MSKFLRVCCLKMSLSSFLNDILQQTEQNCKLTTFFQHFKNVFCCLLDSKFLLKGQTLVLVLLRSKSYVFFSSSCLKFFSLPLVSVVWQSSSICRVCVCILVYVCFCVCLLFSFCLEFAELLEFFH